MSDEDYIVLNKDGDYWAGSGWSENPEKTVDLTIQDAAELVMETLPADILVGDGDMVQVWLGFNGDGICVWVDYPDGMRSYQKRSEAIQAIVEYTGSQ